MTRGRRASEWEELRRLLLLPLFLLFLFLLFLPRLFHCTRCALLRLSRLYPHVHPSIHPFTGARARLGRWDNPIASAVVPRCGATRSFCCCCFCSSQGWYHDDRTIRTLRNGFITVIARGKVCPREQEEGWAVKGSESRHEQLEGRSDTEEMMFRGGEWKRAVQLLRKQQHYCCHIRKKKKKKNIFI